MGGRLTACYVGGAMNGGERGASRRSRRRGAWLVGIALLVACGDDDVQRKPEVELALDGEVTRSSVLIIERSFAPDDCALIEGAVPAPGLRRLLTFDVMIVNFGTADLIVGDPANPVPPLEPDDFEFSPCHGHFHLSGLRTTRCATVTR